LSRLSYCHSPGCIQGLDGISGSLEILGLIATSVTTGSSSWCELCMASGRLLDLDAASITLILSNIYCLQTIACSKKNLHIIIFCFISYISSSLKTESRLYYRSFYALLMKTYYLAQSINICTI